MRFDMASELHGGCARRGVGRPPGGVENWPMWLDMTGELHIGCAHRDVGRLFGGVGDRLMRFDMAGDLLGGCARRDVGRPFDGVGNWPLRFDMVGGMYRGIGLRPDGGVERCARFAAADSPRGGLVRRGGRGGAWGQQVSVRHGRQPAWRLRAGERGSAT
ncbi:hypothetical protein DDE05_40325 [Streptomyces cavourensis]|nr:hypothetical protein DDE05_40325 [Streptomyces cavourensis]